jgi:hypothetical protein
LKQTSEAGTGTDNITIATKPSIVLDEAATAVITAATADTNGFSLIISNKGKAVQHPYALAVTQPTAVTSKENNNPYDLIAPSDTEQPIVLDIVGDNSTLTKLKQHTPPRKEKRKKVDRSPGKKNLKEAINTFR